MALDKNQRLRACDLLILELLVMEDRLKELTGLAQETGFTSINGQLKSLRAQVHKFTESISGKKAATEIEK